MAQIPNLCASMIRTTLMLITFSNKAILNTFRGRLYLPVGLGLAVDWISESCSEFAGHILSLMTMTPKPKFNVLMIRTTSVLNTSSSEIILINFWAHVQFHSDLSSSTRILDTLTRIVRLDFFTRKTIFPSDDYISTRMTIFPLGRQYLTRLASFRSDGNLFTRDRKSVV